MPEHQPMLQEIYRLSQENNRLLHKMRRQALWGRIFTLIFYAAILLAPIWFYWTYLNGTVQQLLAMYDRAQGTGQQAESQYQAFLNAVKEFQQKVQTFGATSSHQ